MIHRVQLKQSEIDYMVAVINEQLKSLGHDPRYALYRESLISLKEKLENHKEKS